MHMDIRDCFLSAATTKIIAQKKPEKGKKIKDFNKHVSWQVAEKRIKRGKGISNVVLNILEFLASILKSKKAAFRAN